MRVIGAPEACVEQLKQELPVSRRETVGGRRPEHESGEIALAVQTCLLR
jgi:hypothetical protein